MKIVKSALIQIVKPSELKLGDFILFDNCKRKIVDVNELNGFIVLYNEKFHTRNGFNFIQYYQRIIECEEVEVND